MEEFSYQGTGRNPGCRFVKQWGGAGGDKAQAEEAETVRWYQ